MQDWYFPSPYNFDSINDFFNDFVQVNSENKSFSYRKLASQLNWPISYLNDLIKLRRSLTVVRAIEFSTLANYDNLQIEKLIFLGLKENLPNKIKETYFTSSNIKDVTTHLIDKPEDTELVLEPHLLLIASIITSSKGKLTIEDLAKLLSEQQITESQIGNIISMLEEGKHLKKNKDGTFQILKNNISTDFTDEQIKRLNIKRDTFFADNYTKQCLNPQRPNISFESFISVPRKHLQAYADKLIALRNWFIESSVLEESSKEETVLLQMNLGLFPAINLQLYEELMKEKTL